MNIPAAPVKSLLAAGLQESLWDSGQSQIFQMEGPQEKDPSTLPSGILSTLNQVPGAGQDLNGQLLSEFMAACTHTVPKATERTVKKKSEG